LFLTEIGKNTSGIGQKLLGLQSIQSQKEDINKIDMDTALEPEDMEK